MPDSSSEDLRMAVARQLLEARVDLYDRLLDTWKGLEGKAQGVAGLSGVFVGAVFAFIRGVGEGTSLGQRQLLAFALLLLAVAVLFAVAALTIRKLPGRPLDASAKALADLPRVEDDTELRERMRLLLLEHAAAWEPVCSALRATNAKKARLVMGGQVIVGTAVIVVVFLSVWVLFTA